MLTKIDILIPHLNSKLLYNCLESLNSQTVRDFEVIIINNGLDTIMTGQFINLKGRVSVIQMAKNFGFSKAINKGILISETELVFVLNDDTILPANTIEKIINLTDSNKNYGSYALKVLKLTNPSLIDSVGIHMSKSGYGNRSFDSSLLRSNTKNEVFAPCGAAAIYRRAMLYKVGLFNESFFFFHEDTEFGFRSQLLNYKCLLLDSVEIFHFGGASLSNFYAKKVEETIKNSLTTLLTCMPSILMKIHRKKIIDFYFYFIKNLIKKSLIKECLKSISSVILLLPILFYKRIKLQKAALMSPKYLDNLFHSCPLKINFPDETWIYDQKS